MFFSLNSWSLFYLRKNVGNEAQKPVETDHMHVEQKNQITWLFFKNSDNFQHEKAITPCEVNK